MYEIDLNKLNNIKIDAVQIVSAVHSNINNLYEELCWPTIGQRRIECTLSMFYKITCCDAPSYLCDILQQTVGD